MTEVHVLCYNKTMRFLKRYWSLIITGALIPLLMLLAINQLQWVQDLGIRERYRLIQGLHATATQLGNAIQNELGIIPIVFDMDGDEISQSLAKGHTDEFSKRWEAWQSYAQSPDIISDLYILYIDERTASAVPVVWQWKDSSFLQVTIDIQDPSLFMFPLRPGDSGKRFTMLIRVNNEILEQKLIPALAEQYLFGKNDYYFRIVDTVEKNVVYESSNTDSHMLFANPDIRYPLLKPDYLFLFNSLPDMRDPGFETVPAMTILQMRRQSARNQENPDRVAEVFFDRRPPEQRDRTERARWVLEAVHKSGSLKAVVNMFIVRNTIISLGTLVLLAFALIALTIAVRRNQELAERQQDFIATVTHELKTPVAVIGSGADNLASGIITDPQRTQQYGTMILEESKKLATMVDRFLIYSRLSSHRPLEFTRLNLQDLIHSVLDLYKQQLVEAEFRVECITPHPVYVNGDMQTLSLALGNLISNAIKHAREGLFLGIDLRKENHTWAIISVRDHGPGISRQERKHIFEAFYRGSVAKSKQIPGSGLGLNVVRRIIETHGGTVSCEIFGELGTMFIIKLPIPDHISLLSKEAPHE
ncbi:integral membrane sensor signal transduction histidine kinase [Gracilinema caldarium DSM 7334]|uniref:histidine kinase n=2 Tax=Gracilinema caldarium TaxID=215591 RepID=F8EXW8_GRAC1|nr:integral membrane sensor signal transduction histidine kinase [Gracilinema caldarium DSM 7334]